MATFISHSSFFQGNLNVCVARKQENAGQPLYVHTIICTLSWHEDIYVYKSKLIIIYIPKELFGVSLMPWGVYYYIIINGPLVGVLFCILATLSLFLETLTSYIHTYIDRSCRVIMYEYLNSCLLWFSAFWSPFGSSQLVVYGYILHRSCHHPVSCLCFSQLVLPCNCLPPTPFHRLHQHLRTVTGSRQANSRRWNAISSNHHRTFYWRHGILSSWIILAADISTQLSRRWRKRCLRYDNLANQSNGQR